MGILRLPFYLLGIYTATGASLALQNYINDKPYEERFYENVLTYGYYSRQIDIMKYKMKEGETGDRLKNGLYYGPRFIGYKLGIWGDKNLYKYSWMHRELANEYIERKMRK